MDLQSILFLLGATLALQNDLIYLPKHVGFSIHFFLHAWLPMSSSLKMYLKLFKHIDVVNGYEGVIVGVFQNLHYVRLLAFVYLCLTVALLFVRKLT